MTAPAASPPGRTELGSPRTVPKAGPLVQYALLAGPLLSMLDSSIVNVAVEPWSARGSSRAWWPRRWCRWP